MRLTPCDGCPIATLLPDKNDWPCISGEYRRLEDGKWLASPQPRSTPLMILGAAGGWQEEQEFRPMVGPSGRKLMDVLTEVGLNECYITNAASCIPPDHGEPEHSAVKACRERLEREIEIVKPRFVLALGNVAVQRLLGRGTISALTGKEQWSGKYGLWVLPAYHPAFILRSPGRESAWRLDLHRDARLIRGDIVLPGKPDIRVNVCETHADLSNLFSRLRSEPVWTFDFETNAIDWWHTDFRARSIGFSFDGLCAEVLLLDHPENPLDPRLCRMLLSRLPARGTDRIAHNALFDALVWYRLTGVIPHVSADTMVMAHLLDENRPKSLKWLGRALLGWPDWDIDLASKTASKEKSPLSLEDFAFYNGADACATYRLHDMFMAQLQSDERLWRYWNTLEMPKLRALMRMVARGIYVDMAHLRAQQDLAHRNWIRDKQKVPVVNPASAPQVAQWLFEELRLTPLKMGKKHGSTDEPSIKRLAQEHPEVRAILPVRKWARYESTYFSPISEMIEHSFDGRYHHDIRSTGTETGRLSSPFHTIPRPTPSDGAFVRSIFTAPA